jgi:hypothetical protein
MSHRLISRINKRLRTDVSKPMQTLLDFLAFFMHTQAATSTYISDAVSRLERFHLLIVIVSSTEDQDRRGGGCRRPDPVLPYQNFDPRCSGIRWFLDQDGTEVQSLTPQTLNRGSLFLKMRVDTRWYNLLCDFQCDLLVSWLPAPVAFGLLFIRMIIRKPFNLPTVWENDTQY